MGVVVHHGEWVRSAMGKTVRFGPPLFKPTGPWRSLQISDMRESKPYLEGDAYWKPTIDEIGIRTLAFVPLLREKRLLGTLALSRNEVQPFTQQQIELVKTFADQAVIAIENVRLFNETKESLKQQTAITEILQEIGRPPSKEKPWF